MKKSLDGIYLIILLVAYNLILVDVDVFGMNLKILILLFSTVAVIFGQIMKQRKEGRTQKLTHMDIAIYSVGVCSFLGLIYKLIASPIDCTNIITVLNLCMVYYALRQCKENVVEDMVLLFSVTNAIVSAMLLWHFLVNPNVSLPIRLLLQDNAILSWLILMITINVIGYCIYEGKQVWYGINAVVGFLLLFIQKNVVAIGIIVLLCLLIPLVYAPTKALIRSTMQMLFVYAFLLCNMSLITGYTGLIKIEVSYDLEVSVYMELLLAVFGVVFFHYWDKYTTEDDDGKKLLPELKEFLKKTIVVVGVLVNIFVVAVIKDSTAIAPEITEKVIEQSRNAITSQTGSFEMVAGRYGIVGVCIVLFLYYTIIRCLVTRRKTKVTRLQKMFRIVTGVFVVQSFFLTQSMVSLPIYMVFIMSFLKDANEYEKKMRGEDTNEIDYSDSVL